MHTRVFFEQSYYGAAQSFYYSTIILFPKEGVKRTVMVILLISYLLHYEKESLALYA